MIREGPREGPHKGLWLRVGVEGKTNGKGKGKGDDNQQHRLNALQRAKEEGRLAARRMLDRYDNIFGNEAVTNTKIIKKAPLKKTTDQAMTNTKIIKKPAAKLTTAKKSVGKGKVKVACFSPSFASSIVVCFCKTLKVLCVCGVPQPTAPQLKMPFC